MIYIVVEYGWDFIFVFFIERGVNINLVDSYMFSFFYFVVWNNKFFIVYIFIKVGCDVEIWDFCGEIVKEVVEFRLSLEFL